MGKIKDTITKAKTEITAIENKVKSVASTIEADMTHVNSAFLNFPTDVHNLTGDLKKVILRLASRMSGAEDKYKVYKDTLEVLMKHIDARFVEAVNTLRK